MTPGPMRNPLAPLERVRVGSTNEPKIAAVRSAFEAYAPRVAVEGAEVSSGVSDQPVGFDEIVLGARNRAAAAHRESACDFGVGIEDGLVAVPLGDGSGAIQHFNIGCAAITDGRRFSLGFSSGFAYPPQVSRPAVDDREPIGELFDRMWQARRDSGGGVPSARTMGNVGKLTGGVLPRSDYARHAVLCALVTFLNPDLYADAVVRS